VTTRQRPALSSSYPAQLGRTRVVHEGEDVWILEGLWFVQGTVAAIFYVSDRAGPVAVVRGYAEVDVCLDGVPGRIAAVPLDRLWPAHPPRKGHWP
jgi:hypothetical protein